MSKQIDPLKKIKYKIARKQNKSIRQSLKDAGYSKATAQGHNNLQDLAVVKCVEQELINELKAKDVTVDTVIKRSDLVFNGAMAIKNYAAANQANKDMAGFVGIDRQITNVTNVYQITNSDDKSNLTELLNQRLSHSSTIK